MRLNIDPNYDIVSVSGSLIWEIQNGGRVIKRTDKLSEAVAFLKEQLWRDSSTDNLADATAAIRAANTLVDSKVPAEADVGVAAVR